MSVNTAHANNGVLLHAGEFILLFSDKVSMEFSGQDNPVFHGTKNGRIYLTTHRMIFNSKKNVDEMQSFSCPFVSMSDVELEQPVFGANYIKGKVRAQPNGNFVGEVKFKLYFNAGGAIEYGQAMLRAACMAQNHMRNGTPYADNPPPYTPTGTWHEAPPPAYQAPPGYYGWLPSHSAFTGPPPNSVFMSDTPPPYPGIDGPPPYAGHQQFPSAPNQSGPATNNGHAEFPSGVQPGFRPAETYNPTGQNQPTWGGFSLPPQSGQPQQGYPNAPPPPYGQAPFAGYPCPGTYNGPAPSQPAGAVGFCAPPQAPQNSKEAEAMRSAYENQSHQRYDNRPPPSYNSLPPN